MEILMLTDEDDYKNVYIDNEMILYKENSVNICKLFYKIANRVNRYSDSAGRSGIAHMETNCYLAYDFPLDEIPEYVVNNKTFNEWYEKKFGKQPEYQFP